MNYFDELKAKLDGLEEAKIEEIIEFSKKALPQEFIPKSKYNEKAEELTQVNEKLAETNKQIEELKNSSTGAEEYKQKLDLLNQEYEDYKKQADTRVDNLRKSSLLKDRLINEGADKDNLDLLLKDFNIEEMQLKDENIVGLDDYVNPIKEKRARLFLQERVDTTKPDDGKGAGDSADTEMEAKMRAAAGLPPKE